MTPTVFENLYTPNLNEAVNRKSLNVDGRRIKNVYGRLMELHLMTVKLRSTRWRIWLRHCATSRKVAGSVLYGVIRIFHWHNPSDRTLESTQPLTEMSTRKIFLRGKGGRCVGMTTLPPSCAYCHDIWECHPPGTLRACPDLYRDCFNFYSWTEVFGEKPVRVTLCAPYTQNEPSWEHIRHEKNSI